MISDGAEIAEWVEKKKRCLQHLVDLSQEAVATMENGRDVDLSHFVAKRDAVLKGIEAYDQKLSSCLLDLQRKKNPGQVFEEISKKLDDISRLVEALILIDKKIENKIEEAIQSVGSEIRQLTHGRRMIGKFKSGHIRVRSELDGKI